MSYFCDKYQVVEKSALAGGIFSITVKCPEAAAAAEVGQFANITAEGYTLRWVTPGEAIEQNRALTSVYKRKYHTMLLREAMVLEHLLAEGLL